MERRYYLRRPSAIPPLCRGLPVGLAPLNLVYVAHGERMGDIAAEEMLTTTSPGARSKLSATTSSKISETPCTSR